MSPDQLLVLRAALEACRQEVRRKVDANGGWADVPGQPRGAGPCPLEIKAVNALQDLVRQVEREQANAGQVTPL